MEIKNFINQLFEKNINFEFQPNSEIIIIQGTIEISFEEIFELENIETLKLEN